MGERRSPLQKMMRAKILFSILIILTKTPTPFSEELNPKDTVGLGKLVAGMPTVTDMWKILLKEPAWSDWSGIVEKYDTIIIYDVNKDEQPDVIASLIYADLPGAGGFSGVLTLVALRTPDSLKLHFSTPAAAGVSLAKNIVDSLIPGSIVLIEESEYSHGFTSANTRFYRIWPQTGLLLSTSTFIYTCSEEEQFRFVRLTKPDTLLIARFFKRKCDPEWHSQLEKGPEKILQIFRFDAANNRYEEWKPKDNRIWKAAMKAFGPLLEGEDLEKLKGQ